MKNLFTKNLCLFSIVVLLAGNQTWAQSSGKKALTDISKSAIILKGERYTFPKHYRTLHIDKSEMQQLLSQAPLESASTNRTSRVIFSMPMPGGETSQFRIAETYVMHPDLAAKFPEIKTYLGQGIDDPDATIRLDMTPLGFHAMVLSPDGQVFIDPYSAGTTDDYICYYKKDLIASSGFVCETDQVAGNLHKIISPSSGQKTSGSQLRTYRLALACTGEYAATKGGTVSGAMAGMTTSMNRVNGVYETETAVRMVMVANNNLIVYTNSSTDPYTNGNGSTMLGQNQTTCNNVIGSGNYDIGHVFSTGGGGVAYLGCVCSSSNKAGGVTGQSNPVGDPFDIDYVAHEMGHQFGGSHTFNSATGSCSGNRTASAAYECGSGITIQAYAGICGSDDLAPHSIAYFHTYSFDQIVNYTTTGNGNTCAVTTSSGNTAPVVTSLGAAKSIPISTPFVLTGSATDANGDPLTYSWEEFDLGPAGAWNVQSTTAPMFRPFEPVSSPSRTFPKLSDIINNTTTIGELLPNQARTLKFRLTVRDNRTGGGGVMHPDTTLNISVVNSGGAFAVTAPNTAVTWAGSSTQTVTWNVSGTTAPPISCANVNILLSTDGGNTFPTTILSGTANDGTQSITVPNTATTTARIKVEAAGNIFFDMSNANFTITASAGLTTITTSAISPANYCAGANVNVPFTTNAAANAGNVFTAQLSNSAGSFASPIAIGTLTSTAAGTIAATIPAGTATGSGYRIRVISSAPVVTGSDNGSNLIISAQVAAAGAINTAFTSFCGGLPITFTTGSIANATTYTWGAPPGAVVSSGQGTTTCVIAFPSSGVTGAVTVFGSNANCIGTSSSLTVTANPVPPTPTANNVSGCAGTPITLSGSPSGGSFSVANPYTGSSTTYTYTVMNGFGCTATSAPANITVNANPTTSITGSTSFCSGSSTILNAGSGFSSYNWSTGATTQTISASTAGTFTVIVTNANGCTGTASATTTVNANPTTSITGSTSFCAGSSTVLNAGSGFSGYNWSTGATTQTISASTAGTFTVTVTNANGCTGTASATTTVNANPTTSITGSTSFCTGSSTVLNAGSGFSGYNWSTGATTQTISANTAGAFTVTVTNANGCTGTASATTVINPLPTVTADNVSGCAGTAIALSGTPSGGTWSVANPYTGVSTTYTHTYTDGNGCTNTSAAANITVNPLPTVSFSGLAASYNVSAPAATLTGSPSGGTFSGPGISGNTFTPSVAGVGGSYTIVYSYTDGNGCSNSSSQQTTVTNCAVPAQPGTITVTGGIAKVCPGDSRTYTIAAVSGATSYTWTPPTGASISSGQGNTSVIINYTAGFTVSGTLSVVANSACGNSIAKTLTISRNNPSTPGVISGAASGVCAGTTGAYSVVNVAGITYNWTAPANASIASGQGTNSVTVSFSASFTTGTLKVTAGNNCGTSGARTLSILSKPATPSVISGASSAVCAGTTGTYSVTNVSGVTYNWTPPANASIASGQGTNSVSVSFSALFTSGSLKVSGSNACGTSALRTLSISSKPAQPGTITGPGYGNCNATATYSIVAVAYATSYTWTTNIAGAIVTPNGTSASISFPAFTSGTVSVTANNVCGSSTARTLTVKGTPATPASITGPAMVCANQFGVPYSIAAIPTATSYTWTGMTGSHISDGVVTSGGTTLTTTSTSVTVNFGSTSGNLNVKANNACGAGTNKTLTIAFNCREINDENLGQAFDVIVHPNPVHDQLNISFESDESTVYSIQLIDLIGKVILELNGVSVTGENNFQFTLDKMAKGMYFLKVINGEKKNISRVTVN